MEYQKIINLSKISGNQLPRYVTKKWIESIRFKKPQLRSDLCDWNEAYIAVTGKITVTNANDRKLALKNNAPFISCFIRIHNILIDDCQDLDIVMPLFIFLQYSKNYQKTSGSLYNYYRDEPNDGAENVINYSIKDSKSVDYQTSLTGKLEITILN